VNPAAEITRLILKHRAVVFGYVMAQTGRYADAEDVFQDVCATVCEKFHEFKEGGDFRAWMLKIARFKVLSHYQKKRPVVRLSPDLAEILAEDPVVADLEPAREIAALRACLQALRGKSRELILGRFGRGLSCGDVAERVGWSAESVYVALSRVRRSLEDCVRARLGAENA
jgi:RNA polymerase sigma-70 factor (ECF subfamily)